MAAVDPPDATLGHYARLQEIEQRVVRAIEAASFAMAELGKEREHIDKGLLHAAATGFLVQIQEAQQLVLQAIRSAPPDRDFEANNYFVLLQAMAAAEKLDAVSVHVSSISKTLRECQRQQGVPREASVSPSAAGTDAMAIDGAGSPPP